MKSKLAAATGLLLTWSAAHGEIMTFSIKFDKPILQPGEVQTISVWADLDPSVGQTAIYQGGGQLATVAAFGAAFFDLVNLANGQSGLYSDLATNPGFVFVGPGQFGKPDGQGNVLGIAVGQIGEPTLVPDDPVLIWQATWTPDHYDPRDVALGLLQTPTKPPTALLSFFAIPLHSPWDFASVPNSFQIIPAPAAASLLGAGGLLMCRRRRR